MCVFHAQKIESFEVKVLSTMKVLLNIHSYILVHQIFQEITSIWCFLAIKCQLSNTLKHICFEKMPRN